MTCSCKKSVVAVIGQDDIDNPLKWGPILWKYLHTIAENLGVSGNTIVDTDQANYVDTLLTTLQLIIPCKECQAHTASYIVSNPIPTIKGLQGIKLRVAVRDWLFHFHNSVRNMKGYNIIVNTPEECVQYTGNISKNLTINFGGTLTVASGDLTVGCTLKNNVFTNTAPWHQMVKGLFHPY